jgi:predicted nucleic acid-binding protein
MIFVLDSSLALAFVFADEATVDTDKILDGFAHGSKAIVPALWRWEVANVLLLAQRRKRIGKTEAHRHLALLKQLPVEIDETALEEVWSNTLHIAEKHGLTCYDAAYLEIAIRRGVVLGSLDRDLRIAAKSEGILSLPKQ